jgi:hypothetical protein
LAWLGLMSTFTALQCVQSMQLLTFSLSSPSPTQVRGFLVADCRDTLHVFGKVGLSKVLCLCQDDKCRRPTYSEATTAPATAAPPAAAGIVVAFWVPFHLGLLSFAGICKCPALHELLPG